MSVVDFVVPKFLFPVGVQIPFQLNEHGYFAGRFLSREGP